MKISDKMQIAVNEQINIIMKASYSFLAISAWFETTPFKGFAKFMMRQKERDQKNAMKLFRYVKDRIGVVELLPIEQPVKCYKSAIEAFKKGFDLIENIKTGVHDLYDMAVDEKDYETQELLYGFAGDYVMEAKNVHNMIDKLEVAGNDPDALLHMDYVEEKR